MTPAHWLVSALRLASVACLAVALTVQTSASNSPEITIQRLFGPEVPTGKYKHPASFDQLKNGDLYLVYYGGDGEYANHTAVYGSRAKKGSTRWSPPVKIAEHPIGSLGNGVVWQAPDGIVWLFYVMRHGATWSTSRIMAKISRDGAKTWSDAFPVTFEEGTMVRGRPITLMGGDYLLPVYHETGHNTEFSAPTTSSFFLRYDPRQRTWTESNRIRSRLGNLQPAPVQLTEQHLIAYCRRGGDYEPRRDGYLVLTESFDGGRTWTEGKDSEFPNPNAAVDLLKLRSGNLILVYNDSMNDRTPLTVALSTDGGQTFPHRRNIISGAGDFGYPTLLQTQDGRIHVLFTSDERTVVRHAWFEEKLLTK